MDAVARTLPDVAKAADALAATLDGGGKIYYCGAGTSGRLGVLDASELPPTFGVEPGLVTALLAGGREAMFEAREGAEDDREAGGAELLKAGFCNKDAVVGVAASGATPWVRGALDCARAAGATTVAISCTPGAPILQNADFTIVADTGPEVLSGSTRMKAGTAQKLILNMLSTAVMAKRGLIWRGEMIAMRPTNLKLKKRAVRILCDLARVDAATAEGILERAAWRLPVALISALRRVEVSRAAELLNQSAGNVAHALGSDPHGLGSDPMT